jgi:streptogramin lyase
LHPELEVLLSDYEVPGIEAKKPAGWVDKNRFLYWTEWYTQNIYRYDTSLKRWNELEIRNKDEM